MEKLEKEGSPVLYSRRKRMAVIEATLAVLVWGASFIATKLALREVSPVTVVWTRFAIGLAVLCLIAAARRQIAIPGKTDLAYFGLLGFLGIAFHQWLQSNGLTTSLASTTAWIVTTTPVLIAILGWLVLKERLRKDQTLGIIVAGLGVLVVITQGDLSLLTQGQFGAPGDKLMMVSALNWAVFSILSRRGLKKYNATRMMVYVMVSGWLFISLYLILGPGLSEIYRLSSLGWLSVLFLGVFCSGLAYIFWYDALQVLPASQVGVFLYLEPMVTVILAAPLLGEAIRLASVAGGMAILLGVWMVNKVSR